LLFSPKLKKKKKKKLNISYKHYCSFVQTCIACLIRRSVFNITPSAASTNITAPSQILRAAVTSSEKLT